jgi:hypothetical protein
MNNKNIIEKSKIVEIVQEIDNPFNLTWEELVELDEIWEAELTESGPVSPVEESFLVHQPKLTYQPTSNINSVDPNTNQPIFLVRIKLNDCYFTKAGALTAFFWSGDKVRFIQLERVEKARRLLRDLTMGELRVVGGYWGLETTKATTLKNELIEGLQEYIQDYESGEVVLADFRE